MSGKNISIYLDKEFIDRLDDEACLTNQSRGQVVARALACLRRNEQNALQKVLQEELDKRFAELYEYVDRKIAEARETAAPSSSSGADK